ncbi:MAG: hypothetical protein IKE94_05555 [Aeriscardovia sp.]|nr:hypothetical protein [Aeriscardovia sp.]MBR6843457.1 hypothetical protein [Prevotella sp.]
MTREEAIALMKCNADGYYPKMTEALTMAIKALEQENILDRIRAEIMDFEEELFHRPNTDYSDYAAVRRCVEIIDKYKTERSEG